ncbi:MAG: hypothetical protein A2Y12_19770 [Planctomycetes bacterium GWF2_42_9]|nr:MAG: hypothetical protein A2Y12_19770 [Planctomycetes bacterium GWF2_42_9]
MVLWTKIKQNGIYQIILLAMTVSLGFGQTLPQEASSIQEELSEPFCYFLFPSDELGFKDCPHGTQLTHDGAFNAGLGELDLFIGSSLKPVHKRVKTMYKDYIPVFNYIDADDGVLYEIQAFGTPYDLKPMNIMINFIRITAKNPTNKTINSAIKAQFGNRKNDFRFDFGTILHGYYTNQFVQRESFDKAGDGYAADGQAWRGEHLVFMYDNSDQVKDVNISLTQGKDPGVTYRFVLPPNASRTIQLKMPFVPVHKERKEVLRQINDAGYVDYLSRTINFWEEELGKCTLIELPDPKVSNVNKASMVYMLMARSVLADGSYGQHVNKIQYDGFFSRDAAYFARVYNMYNRPEIAREVLDHFINYDKDGKAVGFHSFYPDDWGQVLWTMGAHFRATNDIKFARFIFPLIRGHFDKLTKLCNEDPLKLWPIAGPYDNEAITGHYTAHSFWILLGMKQAIHIANELGEKEQAASFQSFYDEYYAAFMKALGAITAKTGGYIPPGLDAPEQGRDWDNSTGGVYPFEVIEPFDPMVTTTIQLTRNNKYYEGIMTYGPNAWLLDQQNNRGEPISSEYWLHHYQTFNVVETLLTRGQQREVIEDMYSILAHTGSTHCGFEFGISPWGDRNPYGNYTPHGWFAARFRELLRNMLVREVKDTLHLASAIAPKWIEPGKTIHLKDAVTDFGILSYTIKARENGADVEIQSSWRKNPEKILFHIPWFVKVVNVEVDGRNAKVLQLPNDQAIELPAQVKNINFKWSWKERPDLSYEKAVELYLDKYYNRPEHADYSYLFPTPRPPKLTDDRRVFSDSRKVEMYIPGEIGKIYYTLNGDEPSEKTSVYEKPITIDSDATIKAITIWEDGRKSGPVLFTLRKLKQ